VHSLVFATTLSDDDNLDKVWYKYNLANLQQRRCTLPARPISGVADVPCKNKPYNIVIPLLLHAESNNTVSSKLLVENRQR